MPIIFLKVENIFMYANFFTLILINVLMRTVSSLDETAPASDACGPIIQGHGAWTPWRDEKCFKLINQFSTLVEAAKLCTGEVDKVSEQKQHQNDRQPLILTINSVEEQKFVASWLFRDLKVRHNVWMGARRSRRNGNRTTVSFEWEDGQPVDGFTNWAMTSPSLALDKSCTQMLANQRTTGSRYPESSLGIGLWTDVSCLRLNLVVCQKRQILTHIQLQERLLRVEREMMEKMKSLTQLRDFYEELLIKQNQFEVKMQEEMMKGFKIPKPRNCFEIQTSSFGATPNSTRQTIYPYGPWSGQPVKVECDFLTEGGGWTIIQKRRSGPMDQFYKDWHDYEMGFGSTEGNYWLGLRAISALSSASSSTVVGSSPNLAQQLRIELEDWDGVKRFALYDHFTLATSTDFYRLTVGNYTGDAGDSLGPHAGHKFSTRDQDHDDNAEVNCAQAHHGAWWYGQKNCYSSNLNGYYFNYADAVHHGDGVLWQSWKGESYSLRSVEIKIRDLSAIHKCHAENLN